MKTICIKTNNINSINYLLEKINNLKIDSIYISQHKFKIYNNIFIHYKGTNTSIFLSEISHIFSDLILTNYQESIIQHILKYEYFYFEENEISTITSKFQSHYNEINEIKALLFNIFFQFLENNKILYLQGFVTFRLKKYISKLENIIDETINEYLIEKEYDEFISLLKAYISSEKCTCDFVHLIYSKDNAILLDHNKDIIPTNINLTKAKYLSDISFSTCDIVLNTLLNILPQKIYLHLIDADSSDNFISTIKTIFEGRIVENKTVPNSNF